MTKNVKVELQSYTSSRDSVGQEVKTWSTYATVYASVKTLRGSAYYAAEQTANETAIELYIWYRSDVLPQHRALMGGIYYEVASPPENLNMENRELLIRLRRVT